ncbi:MAG: lipopolysaccharide heptosyltransferase II [Planctomycetes bacterium]|nr:lipopolysaccharide heptosyltransferase II [Planctomycetota bacterium]
MADNKQKILVWLPSPLGDAVLSAPALGAIRRRFPNDSIFFLAGGTTRQLLSPSPYCDGWVESEGEGIFSLARRLRRENFSMAVLFKNSFGSAMVSFLACIPKRVGYARDRRSLLLTDRIRPAKAADGKYHPTPMIDYYLALAGLLGCETGDRQLRLQTDPDESKSLSAKLGDVFSPDRPVVILVPGGAFGPSKCWPAERFARTADRLIEKYGAAVIVSVAPNESEKRIAADICRMAEGRLYSLADTPLSMGELKALFARADLVITNDTGPRHIAIALGRKIITLFGPNDPAWTQTGYKDEIQIAGTAECVPCAKPTCKMTEHICMESISVDVVCAAADKMLGESAT